MKNKLLVSVFAVAIAAFAFTSCETESNVTEVCSDMLKESIHKSARSLVEQDGEKITISEYEFLGGVDDNRLVYRTITFGNGVYEAKKVDTLTYAYGEWGKANTSFSLLVTPQVGDPFTLWYTGNAFLTPDGRLIGGESGNNVARVEKMEKVIASLPNTEWKAEFKAEFVVDSVKEDSIRNRFVPGTGIVTDTFKVWKGQIDTLSADTACYYQLELHRDPVTLANTGHIRKYGVRTTYNRETKEESIVTEKTVEYDFEWYISGMSSDSKFVVTLKSKTQGVEGENLSISRYKMDEALNGVEFLLGGLTYTRPETIPANNP